MTHEPPGWRMVLKVNGSLLRELRHRAHLSQAELAARAGVPVLTIVELEMESGEVRLWIVQKLAFALGVPTRDLYPSVAPIADEPQL